MTHVHTPEVRRKSEYPTQRFSSIKTASKLVFSSDSPDILDCRLINCQYSFQFMYCKKCINSIIKKLLSENCTHWGICPLNLCMIRCAANASSLGELCSKYIWIIQIVPNERCHRIALIGSCVSYLCMSYCSEFACFQSASKRGKLTCQRFASCMNTSFGRHAELELPTFRWGSLCLCMNHYFWLASFQSRDRNRWTHGCGLFSPCGHSSVVEPLLCMQRVLFNPWYLWAGQGRARLLAETGI